MKKKTLVKEDAPEVYESFSKPHSYSLHIQNDPYCFNSMVGVRKYKITIEIVDEPIEVIHERLEHLWVTSDNHHDWQPLKTQAKKYNYEFKGTVGSKRKKTLTTSFKGG